MRVLITGGAGFIGSHLVDAFSSRGHSVVVLDNLSTGRVENLPDDGRSVRLVRGDIRDVDRIRTAIVGVDVIFHMAALVSVPESIEDPVRAAAINLLGTAQLLAEARTAGVKRVIFASSAAVYGEPQRMPVDEEHPKNPISPYGVHKLSGEQLLKVASLTGGPDTLSFRFFNVYGARQRHDSDYAAVVPIFRERCRQGEAPRIFGDGSATRDFVFVGDVVEAFTRAAEREEDFNGEVFNLARGEATTILELAELIQSQSGLEGSPELAPARAGDIEHSVADVSKLESAFGWKPDTELSAGLESLTVAG